MKVEQTNDCQQTNPQGVCSVSRVPYVSIWMYMDVQMMLYICRGVLRINSNDIMRSLKHQQLAFIQPSSAS